MIHDDQPGGCLERGEFTLQMAILSRTSDEDLGGPKFQTHL